MAALRAWGDLGGGVSCGGHGEESEERSENTVRRKSGMVRMECGWRLDAFGVRAKLVSRLERPDVYQVLERRIRRL